MAAAVAAVLDRERPYRVIAHSLGVYVGLALASGWFLVSTSRRLLGIGPKVTRTDAEVASMVELARKPAKVCPPSRTRGRATAVSGLD